VVINVDPIVAAASAATVEEGRVQSIGVFAHIGEGLFDLLGQVGDATADIWFTRSFSRWQAMGQFNIEFIRTFELGSSVVCEDAKRGDRVGTDMQAFGDLIAADF
jgi:hypothetical protein